MDRLTKRASYFVSIMNTKPTQTMSMEEFYNELTGPALKVRTDAYRRYVAKGMLKEAEDIKLGMPGVTVAGICRTKRSATALKELSGWMMLDFDHTAARTGEIARWLAQLPYVVLTWTSISGEGLKAVVRIDAETPRQYAQAYAVVAHEVSRLVDFPCDMQCKDLARYCSAVYDPEAHYNPAATPFEWQGKAADLEREQREASAALLPAGAGGEGTIPAEPQGAGTGFIASFLDAFLRNHPFVKGTRHELMLKLGYSARGRGFSVSELAHLVSLSQEKLAAPDFTPEEIERSIIDGYQYISRNPKQTPPPPQFGLKVQGSPIAQISPRDEREAQRMASKQSDALRAGMPYFPREVYDGLPDLLRRGLSVVDGPREKDMLLMGLITHLSACLPKVNFLYQQRNYSPHLYFAGVAPAGTGKGSVELASYLSQPLHEYYMKQNTEVSKAYQQQFADWEARQQELRRKHQKMDVSSRPEEPKMVYLVLPANLSKSRLYAHLRDNGSLGGIIHASEINTMVSAVKQDYGRHDDVFCAAFHHEDIASSFKVDGQPLFLNNPRLALCLTGTHNQFIQLIQSLENGLYSRFALLTAESQWVWRSCAPKQDCVDLRSFFRGLGKEVLEWHRFLLESPTEVVFSREQWAEHDACFSEMLKEVVSEGESSSGSIVLRLGVINARIASVLTTLRKCEDRLWGAHAYNCTEQDFHIAMLMTKVLLEHSLLLTSSLPGMGLQSLPLREFHSLDKVLELLPEEFLYKDFIAIACNLKWSLSTARRILKRAVEEGNLIHEGKKYRKVPQLGAKHKSDRR